MSHSRASMRVGVLLAIGCAALVLAGSAFAHAHVSPPIVPEKMSQVFTLAVPTEKEGATTTSVELTPPSGFSIDSFAASPGWTRKVQQTGSGEETHIQKVTWSGGNTPHEEAATFEFLGSTDAAKTYSFNVRQVYSDGSVVDWTGPESSDTPAPTIESKSSLGGGGSDTLAIVALIVGALAAVLAIAALVVRSGKRAVT
jgi:uncharacterized protein YcnI